MHLFKKVFLIVLSFSCAYLYAQQDIQQQARKLANSTMVGLEFESKVKADFWYEETKNYLKKYRLATRDSATFFLFYGSLNEISDLPSHLLFEFKKQQDTLTTVWFTAYAQHNTIKNDATLAQNCNAFLTKLRDHIRKKDMFQRLAQAEQALLSASKQELKTIKKIDLLIKEAKNKDLQIKKLQEQLLKAEQQCHDIYTAMDEAEETRKKAKTEIKEKQKKVEELNKEIRTSE